MKNVVQKSDSVEAKILDELKGIKGWYSNYEGCKRVYFIHQALEWNNGSNDYLMLSYMRSLGIKNLEEAMDKALIYAKIIRFIHLDDILAS